MWSKVKHLNFTITQSVVIIFIGISHADRGTINIKHIKLIFDQRSVSNSYMGLGVGSKGQNSTFSEHGHAAYQIKGNHEYMQYILNFQII